MKSLLGRIGLPKAIGLYVDGEKITVGQVVSTPFGPIEVARAQRTARPDELPSVLATLVPPLIGRGRFHRVPVGIGLPIGGSYFATRPIQNPRSDVSPYVLLREALRSPNVSVNEMAVDVIKAQPDKRQVASIVAYSKNDLTALLDALGACGIRPLRAEPACCALLRAAARRHRRPRNTKVVLRLLLGGSQALAILVAGDLPIVWRLSTLRQGDEASSILSAVRSLMAVSKDCGIESPLEAVMLHGRFDLYRLLDVDWVRSQLGLPVEWYPDPPLDDSQVAFGLALGCLNGEERAFDLSHSLKPRPSLWELLPWRAAILQVGLLLSMALFLADRLRSLNDSCTAMETQNAQCLWMESLAQPELEKEKATLVEQVAGVRRFLDGRITWTDHQRALAACMPEGVFLTSLEGDCTLGGSKKTGRPKKSLVLRGAVVLSKDGSVPQEMDRFLNTLRTHPVLRRDFPTIELTDLKHLPRARGDQAIRGPAGAKRARGSHGQTLEDPAPGAALASFTVVCLPKSGGGRATGKR